MITEIISTISAGQGITEDDAYMVMNQILTGSTSLEQNIDLLQAMKKKGETIDEISGMLRAMRDASVLLNSTYKDEIIDVCGTGGDGLQTINISTAAAFVAAASSCMVAKHGNRSSSGGVGSADIFEALGCNLQSSPKESATCLEKTGVCFMFAPQYHPSMRHVAEARKKIGARTMFNLLGPLCNPARVKKQLVGVSSPDLLHKIPKILSRNGVTKTVAVISESGMDELSTAGNSRMLVADSNKELEYTIIPQEYGLQKCDISQLQVGDRKTALREFVSAVDGTASRAISETVSLNAAAALIVDGKCDNLKDGLDIVMDTISSGRSAKFLNAFVKHAGDVSLLEEIRANAI